MLSGPEKRTNNRDIFGTFFIYLLQTQYFVIFLLFLYPLVLMNEISSKRGPELNWALNWVQ